MKKLVLMVALLVSLVVPSISNACMWCSASGWCEGGHDWGWTICWQYCQNGYRCTCSGDGEGCGGGWEMSTTTIGEASVEETKLTKAEMLVKMQECRLTPGCSYFVGGKHFGYSVKSSETWGKLKVLYR